MIPEGVDARSVHEDAAWLAEVSPTFYRARARVLQYMEDTDGAPIALPDGSSLVRVEWGERVPTLAQAWRLVVKP